MSVSKVVVALAGLLTEGARFKKRSACGTKGMSAQIVGGDAASECEWKWQVGLVSSSKPRLPFCGGMLISDEWVMTAAHCIDGSDFYVTIGDYTPKSPSNYVQKILVTEKYTHPSYKSPLGMSNDIAMVKLSSPARLDGCAGIVCLPDEGDEMVPAGTECWITGWGTLSSGGSQPDVLQEVAVDIISNSDCVNKFGYTSSQIDDSMICAQGRNSSGGVTDACQGDSGGPLVCNNAGTWTIYGATSWGRGCAGARYPGIWSSVTYNLDWVNSVMSGTYTPPEPVLCPDFAQYKNPDSYGECACKYGEKCSVSAGANWDCPSADGPGGWGGSWFFATCEDCQCYEY